MDTELCEKIGEVTVKPGEVKYDWTIRDFFSLSENAYKSYCSGEFLFQDACWKLVLYPNGNGKKTDGWISLYIMRLDCGPPRTISYQLGFKKTNDKEILPKMNDSCTFSKVTDYCWGEPYFFHRTDLLKQKSDLAPEDILVVTCILRSQESHSAEVSLFRRLWNLREDFQKVLNEGERCDVKIQLKDGEVSVHRVIIGERCEVFESMFKTDMRESQTGEISVEDGDADAARVVLSYIYSGEPRGVSRENVCEVYKIAHKYRIEQLTKFCVVFMQKFLSVDIICDVIAVAELYGEKKLMKCVKDYLLNNATEIIKSEKWVVLERDNPAVVSELGKLFYRVERN